MMADVIGGVIQMQNDQALKSFTVEELERELARRKKVRSRRKGRRVLQEEE